jgi:hypothetical protein
VAFAKINKSGCVERHGNVQVRVDFYLEPTDPRYFDTYVQVIDTSSKEYQMGYPEDSKVSEEDWLNSLPKVWLTNPFHSHFIYFSPDVTEAEILKEAEYHLPNFYTAFQNQWDKYKGGMRHGWATEKRIRPARKDKTLKDYEAVRLSCVAKITELNETPTSVNDLEGREYPATEIDIGSAAIDRGAYSGLSNRTYLLLENPANDTGVIDTVEIWANSELSNTVVGTLYLDSGYTYIGRDYESIGTVFSGSKQTFTGLDIDVETGDYIGSYATSGTYERDSSGYAGYRYVSRNVWSGGSTNFRSLTANSTLSIYGTGETTVIPPTITTQAATNITHSSARLPYNLTDDGGDDTTVKVYWGTSDGGTTTGNWQNSYSLGVKNEGSGYYDLSSLSNKTKYYYRYYAENSAGGTWASSTLNFTTLAALPSVTTDSASSITSTSFSMSGNVTGIGGENVSERGFCYIQGTSGTPTTANSKVYDSGSYGTGSYSKSITGLSNKTSYRVRAYAINSAGTAYGSTITVSTLAALPTVTTGSASSIATTSFTMSGNITSIGGENVTQRGFCYLAGTAGTPTTSNSKVYDSGSFGTGTYSKSITGLSDNTSYRVRAYAVNSAGTGYGSTITVKTDRQPQTYNYTASVPMLSVPTSAKETKVSRTSISTITCIPYAAMGVFKIYYYTAVATIGTVATSIKKSITNITSSADIRLNSFALRQAFVSRTSSAIVGLKPEALKARIKSFVGQSIVGCRAIALRASTFNRVALTGVGAKASAIKVRIINRTASAVVGLKAKAELAIYDLLDTIAVFNKTFYDAVVYDGRKPFAIYYFIALVEVGLKATASRAVKVLRTATAFVGLKATALRATVKSFIASSIVGLKPSAVKIVIANVASSAIVGIKASAFRSTVNNFTSAVAVELKATAIKARIKDFVAVSAVGLKSFAEKTRSFSVTATVAVEMIATAFTDTMKVYAYTALAYVGIKPTAIREAFVSRVAQVTVELKPFATRFKDYTVIALSTVEAVPTSVRQFIKNATATVGINLKAFASRHARLNRVASIAVVLKPFAVRFREITFVAVSTVEAVPSAIVGMIYTCVAFVAVGLKSFAIATLTSLKRKIFTALRIRRPLDLELTFKRPFYLELESKGKDRLE